MHHLLILYCRFSGVGAFRGLENRKYLLVWLEKKSKIPALFNPPYRSADKGEREPKARGGGQNGSGTGRRNQRALQHHLLRYAGWDPAFPSDPRARLQGADAALPTAADHLLPKDHGQARRGSAEVRQRVTDRSSRSVGLDLADKWPSAPFGQPAASWQTTASSSHTNTHIHTNTDTLLMLLIQQGGILKEIMVQ